MTLAFYIEGIGLCGPALNGWDASRAVLAGAAPYAYADTVVPAGSLLPPAERRRTTPTVKLALAVGAEAVAQSGHDPATLASVFTSSGGDGETVHDILETLATSDREVSPTRFHNSVHNAPSGYWNIAVKSREPATSLCAYDHSFIAGLTDAVVQMVNGNCPIVLVSYDLPYPAPMQHIRPMLGAFGLGLVLSPRMREKSLVRLSYAPETALPVTTLGDPGLEALRCGNPSARALPLLIALAKGEAQTVVLETLSGRAALTVTPVRDEHG